MIATLWIYKPNFVLQRMKNNVRIIIIVNATTGLFTISIEQDK